MSVNCTMKVEVRTVPPPPPQKEVVITMSVEEVVLLRNDLRSAIDAATDVQRFGINRLWNELSKFDFT